MLQGILHKTELLPGVIEEIINKNFRKNWSEKWAI
jgi:hypothetical protein